MRRTTLYYIYAIRNKINGKTYVGKTVNPEKRKLEHFRTSKTSKLLNDEMKTMGAENFTFEILEENITKEMSDEKEIFWIQKENSFDEGYNLTTGGTGGNTYSKLSKKEMERIRESIRESKLGDNNPVRKNPDLVRGRNNGMYGRKPHNVQKITIRELESNKTITFNTNAECAFFMGYKNSSPISQWKKKRNETRKGYELIEY